MSTSLVEFPNLTKGLQIPDASAEMAAGSLGIATDCDLTKSGTIKQRYGTVWSDGGAVGQDDFQYSFIHDNAGVAQLVSIEPDGTGVRFGGNGTTLTKDSDITGGPTGASGSAQMLRSALSTSDPNTYVSSPTNVLSRWDGSAFTSVANSPKCRYVVQAGWAERLLYCGFGAGATNGPNGTPVDKSIVGVSNPSEPEVYTTDDVTPVAPGDGEDIMGAVTYNGQTFVFKESSFFVFYGENDSGGAVELLFNQRSGVGMVAPGCVAVGADGVYFLADDGIYRTTGGTATCISTQINGLFTGELPSWTPYNRNLPSPDTPSPKFAVCGDKLYCAVSNRTTSDETSKTCAVILVYDLTMQVWVGYYNYPMMSLHAMPWPNLAFPLLVGMNAPNGVGVTLGVLFHPLLQYDPAEGLPVPMQAQLNWFQSPDANGYTGLDQAAIHRLDLWGSGTFAAATVIDFQRDAQTSKEVDFGDLPASLTDVWGDGSDPDDVWDHGILSANNILTLRQSGITADTDGDDLRIDGGFVSPAPPSLFPTNTFGGVRAVTLFWNGLVTLKTSSTTGGNMPVVTVGKYYEASADIGDAFVPITATAQMGITWYDVGGSVISTDTASVVDVTSFMPVARLSVTAEAPAEAVSATAEVSFDGYSAYMSVANIQLREGDTEGNIDPSAYVNGYVAPTSDPDDVWGTGTGSETDLIRLFPPVHKYVFAPKGRGNYLALRFTKTADSGFAYLNPPRATLQSR